MTLYILPHIENDEEAEKVADELLALVKENREKRRAQKPSKDVARRLKKGKKRSEQGSPENKE